MPQIKSGEVHCIEPAINVRMLGQLKQSSVGLIDLSDFTVILLSTQAPSHDLK